MTEPMPAGSRLASMKALLPNSLTLFGLCLGLTSVRFTIEGEWKLAVSAILLATIIDFFDGFSARLMKSTSELGAELDSLSDLICFGVAPAILLYHWTLYEAGWLGWCVVLLFCGCSALRLARFNTRSKTPEGPQLATHIFQGVPAPGAAGLTLAPLYLSFQLEWQTPLAPLVAGTLMVVVSLLMVTTLPTFSLKKISLRKDNRIEFLFTGLVAISLFVMFPWVVLTLASLIYILTIPMSVIKYSKMHSIPFPEGEVSESR